MVLQTDGSGRDGLLYGESAIERWRAEKADRARARALGGKSIKMFGRSVRLPENRWLRVTIGIALVIGGIFGFLPVLGLWMIPLGLVVLSIDLASVRRWRRRSEVWGIRKLRGWRMR